MGSMDTASLFLMQKSKFVETQNYLKLYYSNINLKLFALKAYDKNFIYKCLIISYFYLINNIK